MSQLVVRRLLIDLEQPFERRWLGDDAFRSAFMNALSMSFPVGEQFFIDSVRDGVKLLTPEIQAGFESEVRGFIGQEATHRRIHALFNRHLESQGYQNDWEGHVRERLAGLAGADARHAVAITAANEHLTAMFAEHMLRYPDLLDGAEDRLRTLWMWHASEESEHRRTAFDVYRALGGNEVWRKRWARVVTWIFLTDVLRQTASILRHDAQLWRWRTWASGFSFLFGGKGLLSKNFRAWRRYFAADFHPGEADDSLAVQWLAEHADQYTTVGAPVHAASD